MTTAEYEKIIEELKQERTQIFTPVIKASQLYQKFEKWDNDMRNELEKRLDEFDLLTQLEYKQLEKHPEHNKVMFDYEKKIELIKNLLEEIKGIVAKIEW